jgi:aquaporin Z
VKILAEHWPEYLFESLCLALFMISAAAFTTLLRHPASPVASLVTIEVVRRGAMGLAMGLTAAAIIYSPLGRRSGAHMNPAITITYLRLGKIAAIDAAGYLAGQFVGGSAGIVLATAALAGLPSHPAVNYVTTVPGPWGTAAAFAAEAAISFGLMLAVLTLSNSARWMRLTGVAAGAIVAVYITVESPVSGMSMNPARTFGPALLAHTASTLWIYFLAPPLGMLLAAEAYVRRMGAARVRCAKLVHPDRVPCIFKCGYAVTAMEHV